MHAARLAALEGAILALMRAAQLEQDGPDGLEVSAQLTFDGHVAIDLQWLAGGLPVAGESL